MIDKLNPILKCIVIIILSLMLSQVYNYKVNIIVIAICILLMLSSKRIKIKYLLLFSIPIIITGIGTFFTHFYYTDANTKVAKNIVDIIINLNFTMGIIMFTRLIAFALMGVLFVLTTDKMYFIYSLMKYLKLPALYAYGVLIAINLAPMMKNEFNNSKLSLKIRHNVEFSYTKVLTNMLIHSIKWSEMAALAMEAKGFQNENRSYYIEPVIKLWGIVFSIACILLFILFVF